MVITAVHCPTLATIYCNKDLPWLNRYLDDCGWKLGENNTFFSLGRCNIKDLLEDYIFNEQPESHGLPSLKWETQYLTWDVSKGLY